MKDFLQTQKESTAEIGHLILRWLISSLAIFVAIKVIPGITFEGPGWQLGIVALVLGLLNSLLRPLLLLLSLPILLLTLGLFSLVINALLLELTSVLAIYLDINFHVNDFWAAMGGSLVISLVTTLLSSLAGDQRIKIHIETHRDA